MAAFPDSLPPPLWPGITLKPVDPVARSEMEAGPARTRRRFTRTPTAYTLRFEFDRLEMDIFEGWHRHEINDGESWFDMAMPSGRGITVVSCRFTRMWAATAIAQGNFAVSAEIEVQDRPVMGAVELAGYL